MDAFPCNLVYLTDVSFAEISEQQTPTFQCFVEAFCFESETKSYLQEAGQGF